jgi:hypothetical protein
MNYKTIENPLADYIEATDEDGNTFTIPMDVENIDYQDYLKSL